MGWPFLSHKSRVPEVPATAMVRILAAGISLMRLAKPEDTLWALLGELTGSARADTQAIYLSDGGHFDNLGVYEMIRRRCKRILVIDAGQDGKYTFFDLGMMNYQLAGGRVQPFNRQPTALFVYRGAANEILHCRMYVGTTTELPAGAVERDNNGIKFHIYQSEGVTMVFWQEGAVVCALSSDIPSEQVIQLAFAKAMLPAQAL